VAWRLPANFITTTLKFDYLGRHLLVSVTALKWIKLCARIF